MASLPALRVSSGLSADLDGAITRTTPPTGSSARHDLSVWRPAADVARTYRALDLTNGVRVMLISDAAAQHAAAAACVRVGHMEDPRDSAGLSHYVEHMLFMASERYPEEAGYKAFLKSHGGSSNASTGPDSTLYHFNVHHEYLPGALDRFAQFFIAPLFPASCAAREVRAVDAEDAKNRSNDGRRALQVRKALADPRHDYSKFGTGNASTLRPPLAERLAAHYRAHYGADTTTVAVMGRESLDDLEAMVTGRGAMATDLATVATRGVLLRPTRGAPHDADLATSTKMTAAVRASGAQVEDLSAAHDTGAPADAAVAPSTPATEDSRAAAHAGGAGVGNAAPSSAVALDPPPHPYPAARLRRAVFIEPLRELRSVQLLWPSLLPPAPDYDHTARAVSHLLGHEGNGSLLSALKARGLASALSAGAHELVSFATFGVDISLTPRGLAALDDVVAAVFEYVALLRRLPEAQWAAHWAEQAQVAANGVRFRAAAAPVAAVTTIASAMHEYPMEDAVVAPALMRSFDYARASAVIALMTPRNLLLVLQARRPEGGSGREGGRTPTGGGAASEALFAPAAPPGDVSAGSGGAAPFSAPGGSGSGEQVGVALLSNGAFPWPPTGATVSAHVEPYYGIPYETAPFTPLQLARWGDAEAAAAATAAAATESLPSAAPVRSADDGCALPLARAPQTSVDETPLPTLAAVAELLQRDAAAAALVRSAGWDLTTPGPPLAASGLNLHLPPRNDFIPTDFALAPLERTGDGGAAESGAGTGLRPQNTGAEANDDDPRAAAGLATLVAGVAADAAAAIGVAVSPGAEGSTPDATNAGDAAVGRSALVAATAGGAEPAETDVDTILLSPLPATTAETRHAAADLQSLTPAAAAAVATAPLPSIASSTEEPLASLPLNVNVAAAMEHGAPDSTAARGTGVPRLREDAYMLGSAATAAWRAPPQAPAVFPRPRLLRTARLPAPVEVWHQQDAAFRLPRTFARAIVRLAGAPGAAADARTRVLAHLAFGVVDDLQAEELYGAGLAGCSWSVSAAPEDGALYLAAGGFSHTLGALLRRVARALGDPASVFDAAGDTAFISALERRVDSLRRRLLNFSREQPLSIAWEGLHSHLTAPWVSREEQLAALAAVTPACVREYAAAIRGAVGQLHAPQRSILTTGTARDGVTRPNPDVRATGAVTASLPLPSIAGGVVLQRSGTHEDEPLLKPSAIAEEPQSTLRVLVYGNVCSADSAALAEAFVSDLAPTSCTPLAAGAVADRATVEAGSGSAVDTSVRPRGFDGAMPPRTLLLRPGSLHVLTRPHPSATETNACVVSLWQLGALTPATFAAASLLSSLLSQPAFDTLRTKEALGYLVSADVRVQGGAAVGVAVAVQSSRYGVAHLTERIDAFVAAFRAALAAVEQRPALLSLERASLPTHCDPEGAAPANSAPALAPISDAAVATAAAVLADRFVEPDKTQGAAVARLAAPLTSGSLDWAFSEAAAAEVRGMDRAFVLRLVEACIIAGAPRCRRFVSRVYPVAVAVTDAGRADATPSVSGAVGLGSDGAAVPTAEWPGRLERVPHSAEVLDASAIAFQGRVGGPVDTPAGIGVDDAQWLTPPVPRA